MNFRRKTAVSLLLSIALCLPLFAQQVNIPDPNLHGAIRDALNLPDDAPITQVAMQRLTKLEPRFRGIQGITNLSGLEFATNLEHLDLAMAPISDLAPLANLAQLRTLWIWGCEISDITPLANLTGLTNLDLSYNRIADINPLANLTSLVYLLLRGNRIVDVSPLVHLTNLELLYIQGNLIADHSPLDGLPLIDFRYDEACEMSPSVPVLNRIGNRTYPSVFTFWGGILNRPQLSEVEDSAMHDLLCCPQFGLDFGGTPDNPKMVVERGSLEEALQQRDEFFSINPNMIFIVQLQFREALRSNYPDDWPYWLRDAQGKIAPGWNSQQSPPTPDGLINFTHPGFQDRIVAQAVAVSKCGLFDGIFFDWWHDDTAILHDGRSLAYVGAEAEQRARDNIIQRIRAETRPDFLIMGNRNRHIMPKTGHYMNGSFMETILPHDEDAEDIERGLTRVENSLLWLEQNLRKPRINSLEGSSISTEPPDSSTNLRWMRALTTLSLTFSDGYVLFSEPRNHDHYWYDFWDADLGRPVGPKTQLYDEDIPGLYIREFTNGWAVYNHSGTQQVVTLPEEAQAVASGWAGTEHVLPNLDGEMYLKAVVSDQSPVTSKNPADVNGDGAVNILDLTLVAQALSTDKAEGDVNGDGVVNVFDLVFVANQF